MKKNGFTLVEVMAVVVILAILLSLGVGIYNRVYENQQQKTYEHKVSMIELSAEKWATETNLSRPITITVQKLIDDTYFQADSYDEDNAEYVVEDPRDNSSLLCNTIDITIENGTPKATMNETKDCDLKEQESDSRYIIVYPYQYYPETNQVGRALSMDDTNTIEWTKTAVLLLVNPNGKYKDETYSKVIFSSGANSLEKEVNNNILNNVNENSTLANPENYANVYVVDASLFLQAEYTISLETVAGIKNKDVYVQIDKEAPTIEAFVEGSYTNAEKTITLRGSDGAGSGLKGFYVSTSPTNPGSELIASDYEATVKKPNGTYYVFAEDKVGNISDEGKKVEVKNIDESTPSCKIEIVSGTLGSNGWYTSNVTIRMTSESAATGTGLSYAITTSTTPSYDQGFVREGEIVTKDVLLSTDKIHKYYGYVKNSIGATGTCSIEVKVDKTPPSCVWSGESTQWTQNDRTISLACSDATSGCVTTNIASKKYSWNTKTDNWNYTIRDNAGLTTACNKAVNVYVDKFTEFSTSYGSWGSCSESCGGGTQYRTVTKTSTFGSGFTSTSTESRSCNTDPCSSGGGGDGGDSGGGDCCYAPDGTSNCWGNCGFSEMPGVQCCTHCGPCH